MTLPGCRLLLVERRLEVDAATAFSILYKEGSDAASTFITLAISQPASQSCYLIL
jgi:hypothetical protein